MKIDRIDVEPVALLSTPEPSLRKLAYFLRHREEWPEEFQWCYRNCETCAMGLAWKLGIIESPDSGAFAAGFDIAYRDASTIVFFAGPDKQVAQVTPEDVASLIDKYLAK